MTDASTEAMRSITSIVGPAAAAGTRRRTAAQAGSHRRGPRARRRPDPARRSPQSGPRAPRHGVLDGRGNGAPAGRARAARPHRSRPGRGGRRLGCDSRRSLASTGGLLHSGLALLDGDDDARRERTPRRRRDGGRPATISRSWRWSPSGSRDSRWPAASSTRPNGPSTSRSVLRGTDDPDALERARRSVAAIEAAARPALEESGRAAVEPRRCGGRADSDLAAVGPGREREEDSGDARRRRPSTQRELAPHRDSVGQRDLTDEAGRASHR